VGGKKGGHIRKVNSQKDEYFWGAAEGKKNAPAQEAKLKKKKKKRRKAGGGSRVLVVAKRQRKEKKECLYTCKSGGETQSRVKMML